MSIKTLNHEGIQITIKAPDIKLNRKSLENSDKIELLALEAKSALITKILELDTDQIINMTIGLIFLDFLENFVSISQKTYVFSVTEELRILTLELEQLGKILNQSQVQGKEKKIKSTEILLEIICWRIDKADENAKKFRNS